jgi:hypothetical protein
MGMKNVTGLIYAKNVMVGHVECSFMAGHL